MMLEVITEFLIASHSGKVEWAEVRLCIGKYNCLHESDFNLSSTPLKMTKLGTMLA